MYTNVTSKFKELMVSNRGQMSSEIYIEEEHDGTVVSTRIQENDIISIDYSGASSSEQIRVGTFVLPTMTAKVKSETAIDFSQLKGKTAKWHLLLKDETMQQYDRAVVCKLKIRRVSPRKNGEAVTITAESKLVGLIDKVYTPTISMPASSHDVLDDMESQLGVTVNHDRVSGFNVTVPQYATYRDVLCAMAEYMGLFVSVSRTDDEIFFIWYGTAINQTGVQTVSEDCCAEIELTTADENYNGIVCPTPSAVITQGFAPFLTFENKIGLFTATPARVSQLVERISDVKCRTGRVNMILGNILYDTWDVLKFVPERHNVIGCNLQTTTVNGISITRNTDGTYTVSGVASADFTIDFETNDIPPGAYNFIEDIVDPEHSIPMSSVWWQIIQYNAGGQIATYINDYGTVTVPQNEGYTARLALTVFQGAVFQDVLIRPMLTEYDDDYDEWEEYKPDELFPACQIDHHYDGGLQTLITIPEISQNDDGIVEYSNSSEQMSADIATLAQQIASKADSSTVQQLAATVAGKADAATVGAQIADLTRRVEVLEQGGGGGRRSAVLQTANIVSRVTTKAQEVTQ